MRPVTRRRLTLSDGMILVAASAVGLGIFQMVLRTVLRGQFRLENLFVAPQNGWTPGIVLVRSIELLSPTLPFAASWTAVVPILRFRKPTSRWHRTLRQPGTTACFAAVVGFVWAALGMGAAMSVETWLGGLSLPVTAWLAKFVREQVFPDVGLAVSAVWIIQALSGRWRPAPDWIDRFGRVLGVFWILAGLIWTTRRYLDLVR